MTFAEAPIDAESAERLAGQKLRLGLVDTSDARAFSAWLQADTRGFHGSQIAEKQLAEQLGGLAYRRSTGVWDATAADPATPVATVSSWPVPLTVPEARTVDAWAISSVTVAPTHRRRGIARALLEAELRTADALGIPLATLTVSEATIYGRYGFGPAAFSADLAIDTRSSEWSGPTPSGRLHFVTLEQLREKGRGLFDRARLRAPGEIDLDDYAWGELLGLLGDEDDRAKQLRAVRYDDHEGALQGFAVYRVVSSASDFSKHTVVVEYLLSASDDAYAALWRYLIELDLVGTVTARFRTVDEPLLWQLSNPRAVRTTRRADTLWTRILDLSAALEARGYNAPGRIALDVRDPLGFANERVLLTIERGGSAKVMPLSGEAPADAAELALGVNELSSLYLGGVSASTLLRAGRLRELRAGSAVAFDASFRSTVAPWLSGLF